MNDSSVSGSKLPAGIQSASEGETPYSQVSILAIFSLVLALFYVLGLLALGSIALLRKESLLLPVFSFLLPMSGLLLGWLALTQIKASEGALTGISLATWAMRLSLIFGLLYGAYFSATNMAIHRQGQSYAIQWLQMIKEGKMDEAFWMTLPQPRPAFSPGSKTAIETRFNSNQDFNKPDSFSGFIQQDYVRLIQNSDGEVVIGSPSLTNNSAERGGFVLTFRFPIKTKYADFPLVLTVFGKSEKSLGRQFRVVTQATHTDTKNLSEMMDSKAMKELLPIMQVGGVMAQTWLDRLKEGNLGVCYELTLPENDRKPSTKDYLKSSALGSVVGLICDENSSAKKEALSRFQNGEIFQLLENFYCSSDLKKESVVNAIRGLVSSGGEWMFLPGKGVTRGKAPMPLIDAESGKKGITLRYDYQLMLDKIVGQDDNVLVECQVKIRAEDNPDSPEKKTFRVEGVDLLRARVPPPSGPNNPAPRNQ